MPKRLVLPCQADGTTSNPSDVLAQLLHEHRVSKFTILRTIQHLVNDKVGLNDTKSIEEALRDAAEEMHAHSSFGGHLVMQRMKGGFFVWVKDHFPNADRDLFKPLTPEVEAWFSALPTKADLAWAKLDRK
jgi:hypothetical protein